MGAKALTARLQITSEDDRASLWRTHRIFNERLRWVLRQVLRMKRGEPDARYAEIFAAVRSAQGASACLEAVTSPSWKPKKDLQGWRKAAADLIAEGKLLFDRFRDLPGLSKEFCRKLFEAAFQVIAGHKELVAAWKQEHEEWKKACRQWEQDHPEYMSVRPALEAFEAEHGQAGKRRERWHKWLAFLRSRPDLAAWRGGRAAVSDIPAEALRRMRCARPNKRNKIESEEFFKVNPELKALDADHGYYQREFARPRAKRRNPDGFKHRPTFTQPSPENHPFWFQFKKGDTYKRLDLKECSLSVRLLASDDAAPGWHWRSFRFRPDPRLRLLRPAPGPTKAGNAQFTCLFTDPALGMDRPAEIRGAKLIFRPARPDGRVYLTFTCDLPDLPSRISLKQASCDKYGKKGAKWLRGRFREELEGHDPVTCAVDLGIRHLAAATVRRDGKIVRARILREDEQPARAPRLPAIARHKRSLAAGRRKRGKPVRGQDSFVELQAHVTKMGQDRFKKGARRIVAFARENACDLILIENLAGMIPDAERERGINRALMSWNRGNLVKWVKQFANDVGIRVVQVAPHWSSQLCSRCGSLGARFSAERGQPVFNPVGKTFACPRCGYTANADHNASVNIHRRFYGELPQVQNLRQRRYRVTKPGQPPEEVHMDEIERRVFPRAADMCRGEPFPLRLTSD
jgi:IS605 OrfB family transposase